MRDEDVDLCGMVETYLADPATPICRRIEDVAHGLLASDRGEILVGFAIMKLRDAGELRYCPDTGWGLPCRLADKGCTAPEWRGQPEHSRGLCVECGAAA